MAIKQDWLVRVRAGEGFENPDWDFLKAIFAGKARAMAFNAMQIGDLEQMQQLTRETFGKVGNNVIVVPPITLDVGFHVEIGDGTFINANVTLLDTYPIRIGREVKVGPNCAFYPVGHPLRAAERNYLDPASGEPRQKTIGAPIVVEDSVWIGGNSIILQGVTIGARTMIGAGSVVTKSIPPDVFAAGNPCRVIKPLD